jgi:hypothetical protein
MNYTFIVHVMHRFVYLDVADDNGYTTYGICPHFTEYYCTI